MLDRGPSTWKGEASLLPLAGLRVLATRPSERSEALAEQLRRLGAQVSEVPAIAFAGPGDWGPLDAALLSLDRFQWVAFTSATAVAFCVQRLAALDLSPVALARARIAAVGPATSKALADRGLPVHLVPRVHTGQGLFQEMAPLAGGQRLLLPRAEIADGALPRGLRAAGVAVEEVVAYRTIAPANLSERLHEALAAGVDILCFSSPSAVRNVVAAAVRAEPAGGPAPSSLLSLAVAALGPTTARAAREEGLEVAVQVPEGSITGLVEALCRWRASIQGGDHGHRRP